MYSGAALWRRILFEFVWLTCLPKCMGQRDHEPIKRYSSHHESVRPYWVDAVHSEGLPSYRNVRHVNALT